MVSGIRCIGSELLATSSGSSLDKACTTETTTALLSTDVAGHDGAVGEHADDFHLRSRTDIRELLFFFARSKIKR
jgi:hypothetical protein